MIEKINRTTQNHNHVCCSDTIKKVKTQSTNGEKIYHIANYMPQRICIIIYCFKNHNVNNKKTTQLKAQIRFE